MPEIHPRLDYDPSEARLFSGQVEKYLGSLFEHHCAGYETHKPQLVERDEKGFIATGIV